MVRCVFYSPASILDPCVYLSDTDCKSPCTFFYYRPKSPIFCRPGRNKDGWSYLVMAQTSVKL